MCSSMYLLAAPAARLNQRLSICRALVYGVACLLRAATSTYRSNDRRNVAAVYVTSPTKYQLAGGSLTWRT